jgi:ParB family transcriptional regulator, chromosome partitioning protein
MTNHSETPHVELIPIDKIRVLNPRERNHKVFQQIIDSISKVGLKKPITVSPYHSPDGETIYQLVCGQGRLEAYISLAQKKIPAIVIHASEEDRLIMSLVENLARRQHRPLELLQDIGELKKRGYSEADIASKVGLTREYIHSIVHLLEKGEERLLVAVEAAQIPLSVALIIAETDLEGAQEALAQAYEKGLLRGKKLLTAKRVIERRQRRGKGQFPIQSIKKQDPMSTDALVRAYQKETDRQHLMIKKANVTQSRLLFIVEAMRTLLRDENFLTLLRAESLSTMPSPIADLITTKEGEHP